MLATLTHICWARRRDRRRLPRWPGALEDSDPTVRRQAALTLGGLRSEQARAALAAAALDTDPLVRHGVAVALANWTKPRATAK